MKAALEPSRRTFPSEHRHRQSGAVRPSRDRRGRRQCMPRPVCKWNVLRGTPGLRQCIRPRRLDALPKWRFARPAPNKIHDLERAAACRQACRTPINRWAIPVYILPQTSCGRADAGTLRLDQIRYPFEAITASYGRWCDITAQAIRASLLASATNTTLRLARRSSACS
jgi:hypothetical protein